MATSTASVCCALVRVHCHGVVASLWPARGASAGTVCASKHHLRASAPLDGYHCDHMAHNAVDQADHSETIMEKRIHGCPNEERTWSIGVVLVAPLINYLTYETSFQLE